MLFKNRQDAGTQLAQQLLKKYKNWDGVVYALPRGGVVVAAEISKSLHAPMDLLFAHKIGHPSQTEYAIAAVSERGHMIEPSPEIVQSIGYEWLQREKEHQINEIKRKRKMYLKESEEISVENKIAVLVDDGMATGLTMQVGISELKERHPKKIIVAVPVAPKSVASAIKALVDDYVGIEIEDDHFLGAVGSYYGDFDQVEDEEVVKILHSLDQ